VAHKDSPHDYAFHKHSRRKHHLLPGNANLPIGGLRNANREIGVPGEILELKSVINAQSELCAVLFAGKSHKSQSTNHQSPITSLLVTSHDSRITEAPMGRGAQAQTQAMINQQLAQQNAFNQQLNSSGQALGSAAASGYQNLLANPGYTDAQKSAVSNLSQSGLSSAFNALAQNASTRAARTRNSAGYGEIIDSLSRAQGQDQANLAQRNQLAFGNAARSDTLSALGGLSGLYGVDSNLLGRALGIPAQLLDASSRNAQGSGFRLGFGPGGLSFGFNG
jgi:hypothetical protein